MDDARNYVIQTTTTNPKTKKQRFHQSINHRLLINFFLINHFLINYLFPFINYVIFSFVNDKSSETEPQSINQSQCYHYLEAETNKKNQKQH